MKTTSMTSVSDIVRSVLAAVFVRLQSMARMLVSSARNILANLCAILAERPAASTEPGGGIQVPAERLANARLRVAPPPAKPTSRSNLTSVGTGAKSKR